MTAIEFNAKLVSLKGALKKYAFMLTHDEDNADDLLQDTFLKVLENRDKFDVSTNMKAWTFAIMKNAFINSYRRAKRSSEIMDSSKENFFYEQNAIDETEKPDESLRAYEISAKILELSKEHREAFQLFHSGYKYKEIANILGVSIGTVKSRIFFGRKRLMNSLKDYAS
ncbi:RNA polymerase sigma factor [Bacteroidales bacterium OttesenSCG-928-J16]|nr:RNA polymerase sigma factor [Bacteroidales bacterium OttesenSCG-928-J16]